MAPGDLIDCDIKSDHWRDAMHALKLLHKRLSNALPGLHRRRLTALTASVEALLRGRCLWLSELGRHVPGKAKEKHKIKRIDRLLGNHQLAHERPDVYRWLARLLIGGCRHPCIIVDWSDVDTTKRLFILRAAVSVGGRALPVYEEVHERYHHAADQRAFLTRLAQVLPAQCTPVIVTDAGFRGPWFKAIEARGWYYVGRVRNRDYARFPADSEWFRAKQLYRQATSTPRALGALWLTRSSPWSTRAYVYRKRRAGRHRLTAHGRRKCNGPSEQHARREREPWLLVSNLPARRHLAKRVVGIYRDRMTIEEAFRDLKASRHGFAFRHNLGRNPERVANLLLIAAVASLALWLTGLVGIKRRLDRGLQANTERRRRVLSIAFIGKRLIAQRVQIGQRDLRQALDDLAAAITERAVEIA